MPLVDPTLFKFEQGEQLVIERFPCVTENCPQLPQFRELKVIFKIPWRSGVCPDAAGEVYSAPSVSLVGFWEREKEKRKKGRKGKEGKGRYQVWVKRDVAVCVVDAAGTDSVSQRT